MDFKKQIIENESPYLNLLVIRLALSLRNIYYMYFHNAFF